MRCLTFAYSEIGVTGLESLFDGGQTIVGVVTHEDNPWEFKWFRSVAEWAVAHHIPVIKPADPNTPETLAWAKALKPDILFSFYYRQMLKAPLLELCPLGAYNLHGSLLPKFRGRAPVNWAILEGAKETGVTLHEMTLKPDAGRMLGQKAAAIDENDTAQAVFNKMVPQARKLLDEVVPQIAKGTAQRIPQDASQATYFSGRKAEDGQLDWSWPAERIHNMVRALTRPYPGAFTAWEGKKLLIWKGERVPERATTEEPGAIISTEGPAAYVATGSGIYKILEVQREGEPPLAAGALLKQGSFCERSRT